MIDVESIFKNKTLDSKKLISNGFCLVKDRYEKEYAILQERYRVVITISSNSCVDFCVYDNDTEEEYMLAHVYHATGSVVSEIHEACEMIMKEIVEHCCIKECYESAQTKRMLLYIKDTYDIEPAYLWEKYPTFAAMREPKKKTWFALFGKVDKQKLGITEEGMVDIINVKDVPEKIEEYIHMGIAYPAYHMNKKHWCSLILDDHLSDAIIQKYIDHSYTLVTK